MTIKSNLDRLVSYFFITGILGNLILMSGIFAIRLYVGEPISFFIERTSNYLAYTAQGGSQQLGKILLQSHLFNDWSHLTTNSAEKFSDISNWQGQGASETVRFAPQEFDGFNPKKPTLLHNDFIATSDNRVVNVTSSNGLISAIQKALPGDIIQLAPGTYSLNQTMNLNASGDNHAPITVRSEILGTVKLKLNAMEGFKVLSPYWVFENLDIQGVCENDSDCEHAFHVVGKGHSFVLRNNRIYDFNALIKTNGEAKNYPDNGLIEGNSIYNTRPRETANPVTLLNINSASHWIVRGNLIADFSKVGSNQISYGAFMKGNGSNGIFERNLVICEMNLPADKGVRIGLSFGGGGTGTEYCRNNDCSTEHTNGTMRNNIIMNCSHDVGIYLNKSALTAIYNNLLFNSSGIDVRFDTTSAVIVNNIISGRIKERDGGVVALAKNNLIDVDCVAIDRKFSGCDFTDWFNDIKKLDLGLLHGDELLGKATANLELKDDFCGNPVNPQSIDIGAIQYSNEMKCNPTTLHAPH
jgi:hypothetical protein